MRTTLDLPDDLFRRLKAHAALQGKTLREVFLELAQKELGGSVPASATDTRQPMGRRRSDFVD